LEDRIFFIIILETIIKIVLFGDGFEMLVVVPIKKLRELYH